MISPMMSLSGESSSGIINSIILDKGNNKNNLKKPALRQASGHGIPFPDKQTPSLAFFKKIINGEKLNRTEKTLLKVVSILGLGGLCLGYNVGVVSGGLDKIRDRFNLSEKQESFFVSAMALGSVIGCLFGGVMADKIGRWYTCQLQAFLFLLGVLVIACGDSFRTISAGRFIVGIGAAIASIASVPYLNEISPAKYRGRFQGAFEISVSIGILLSNIMNLISLYYSISWRFIFGFPLFFVILQSLLLFLVPESPSFLAQQGRFSEASKALEIIYNDPEIVENESYGLRLENLRKPEGILATYLRLTSAFRLSLVLVIFLVIIQSTSGGFIFSIYGSEIFENSGFSSLTASYYNLSLSLVRLVVIVIAVLRIDTYGWGRRQLLLRGIILSIIGYIVLIITYGLREHPISRYFYLIDSVIVTVGQSASLGVIPRVLQSELFPTIIRSRTYSITSIFQNLSQYLVLLFFLSATDASNYATIFTAFLFFSILGFVYVYFLIPETIGRSPEQILAQVDEKFQRYISRYLCCECICHKNSSKGVHGTNSLLESIIRPTAEEATLGYGSYVPPHANVTVKTPQKGLRRPFNLFRGQNDSSLLPSSPGGSDNFLQEEEGEFITA